MAIGIGGGLRCIMTYAALFELHPVERMPHEIYAER